MIDKTNTPTLDDLLRRSGDLLERIEQILPPQPSEPEWDSFIAFRWRRRTARGYLEGIRHPHNLELNDLACVNRQKEIIQQNTKQFAARRPANNVLLWGSRGTGKSSLIKALLNEYANSGLRLIEIDKHDLLDLPEIVDLV